MLLQFWSLSHSKERISATYRGKGIGNLGKEQGIGEMEKEKGNKKKGIAKRESEKKNEQGKELGEVKGNMEQGKG